MKDKLKAAAAMLGLLIGLFATTACAESPNPDPVVAGREALSSGGRFPWYDRRKDDVRRLNVVPRESADDRGAQWTATSTNTPAPTTRNWPRLGGLATFLQWA